MADNRKKTTQIMIRVTPELKSAAERAARADSRSLTLLIEKLLKDHLKALGIDDPDNPPPRN